MVGLAVAGQGAVEGALELEEDGLARMEGEHGEELAEGEPLEDDNELMGVEQDEERQLPLLLCLLLLVSASHLADVLGMVDCFGR